MAAFFILLKPYYIGNYGKQISESHPYQIPTERTKGLWAGW